MASPHHLASSTGLAVLASGGNALDAAIATNLTLGVVLPYLCGYGGDLFAIVWKDGIHAYNGSGRAPREATSDRVRQAAGSEAMPVRGPLAVTVPGVVEAWFTLLDRFGTRSFWELAGAAVRYARDGFVLSEHAAESLARSRRIFADSPDWQGVYGAARAGVELRQPDLARTIETLSAHGPDAYYRGPIAEAVAGHLRARGGLMALEDLASHHGDWFEPLRATYRGVEILELPPNTQGVTALEALTIVDGSGSLPSDGEDRHHLMVEAAKLALEDRNLHLADPSAMQIPAERLISAEWAAARRALIDPTRASAPPPSRSHVGGTAYVCAADSDGMCVSLIQSNYMGFGSGVTVPGWGINLQNRGASFSLDPGHPNAVGPGKRPMHTLIPALALKGGRPWLAFGTMGGDGQPQTHLQLLTRLLEDGEDLQRAIDAPRWALSPQDWTLSMESRWDPEVVEGLGRRGHRVELVGAFDSMMGHAHAIEVTPNGYAGATDPRAEGAVVGL